MTVTEQLFLFAYNTFYEPFSWIAALTAGYFGAILFTSALISFLEERGAFGSR